jgi:hypothetical protein
MEVLDADQKEPGSDVELATSKRMIPPAET